MSNNRNLSFETPHFRLQELAQGVFAAIHKDGGAAVGNAGLIDLGDRVLVFDTFISPLAAVDLRTAADELIGKPIKHVINSHYHNDHIRGNQVFSEAEIIASQATLKLIQTAGMREYKWDRENAADLFETHTIELAKAKEAKNEEAIRHQTFYLDYFRVIAESLQTVHLRLPNITYDTSLSFEGPLRRVELISYGVGHTGDDAILILPDEGIAFLADLLFVGCHPFLANGDPVEWLHKLEKINELRLKVFVPGHGPVGAPNDLDILAGYIRSLMEIADEIVSSHQSTEIAALHEIPEPYKQWEFPMFFNNNLEFLCGRLEES